MDMFIRPVLEFEWDGQVCYVSPETEDVFFNNQQVHIETLWKRGWDGIYVAAVDALVQHDEQEFYG